MIEVLLTESIFVGAYCLILYTIIKPNNAILWFALGFIKHFMAYFIQLHNYYCKNGYACVKYNQINSIGTYITIDSFLEGLLFIGAGYFVNMFDNKYLSMFFIGCLIHLIAEFIGLHKFFCINRCYIDS